MQQQIKNFDDWRTEARKFLAGNIPPEKIIWNDVNVMQQGLFEAFQTEVAVEMQNKVPKEFMQLAEKISCHSDPEKWHILYSALWRITRGERFLLDISTDKLVRRMKLMEKSVKFDAHKTKAFVRFRLTTEGHYIAWHNPDHMVLKLVAPFFSRRFSDMSWTIFTSRESVSWNGEELVYGAGMPASEAPAPDVLEDMWRAYYRSTFNPARIKIKAMKKEMPVRHWKTLPEAEIIEEILKEAPKRVEKMIEIAKQNLG